jgi:mono/diheme cytochrome c family protein
MNVLGAEKSRQAFAGGTVDGWEAPALTTLSNRPTPWTRDQLVGYLQTGLASQHGAAAGPMLPVAQALADASDADVAAIATYLMSLQRAAPSSVSVLAPGKDASAQFATQSGAVLFAAACASCHGAGAAMLEQGRPTLSQSTAVDAASPRNAVRLILDGIPLEDAHPTHYMPSFATSLTDAQIADIARYVRAQYSTHGPWAALDETAVARIRKESPAP